MIWHQVRLLLIPSGKIVGLVVEETELEICVETVEGGFHWGNKSWAEVVD